MADTNASGTPQVGNAGGAPVTPQVGNAGNDATTPQVGTPPSAPQAQLTPEQLADALEKTRAENARYRTQLQQHEEAQKAAELAKMGELEKLQKQFSDLQERNATLEAERQNWRLADDIARQAPALGLIDPDAARVLLLTGGELETDGDGNYKNVEKLLEKLVAAKPYLVASNNQPRANFPTSGGATNPGRSAVPAAQQPTRPSGREMYQRHRDSGGLGNTDLWKR